MDVLVHLLAFEQIAGAPHGEVDASAPWLSRSELFSSADRENGVAHLAAELLTSPTASLEVSLASGGQIVRGAAAAAAALYSGRSWTRIDGQDKTIDRSVAALVAAGWSVDDVRSLLREWSARDEMAAVVLVALEADGSADALHELTCRYPVMHTEIDFVSPQDARRLAVTYSGSVRVLCLRAEHEGLRRVAAHHEKAIASATAGGAAEAVLQSLWDPERTRSSSTQHDQLLRKLRRKAFTGQLLDLARGR